MSFASRLPRASTLATRRFATAPPPAPPPPPPPAGEPKAGGVSPAVYVVGALLAGGAGYYYYSSNPAQVAALKDKARAEEQLAVRHAKDMGNNALAAGQDRLAAARSTVSGSLKDAEAARDRVVADADARAHKVAADAQATYDSAKASTKKGWSGARSSTEDLYKEARAETEDKAQQAKAGWFSWLGWGSAKAEEGKEKAAREGAKAAGDVQKKLDKHA